MPPVASPDALRVEAPGELPEDRLDAAARRAREAADRHRHAVEDADAGIVPDDREERLPEGALRRPDLRRLARAYDENDRD